MDQIVDLEKSSDFNMLDITLVSLATDPLPVLRNVGEQWGVTTPLLSDYTQMVCDEYGIMQWTTPEGEPGHTFVLIDEDGTVKWIGDYGAEQSGGRMYVPVSELISEINTHLAAPLSAK